MRSKPERNRYFNKQEQPTCGTKAWMAQLLGYMPAAGRRQGLGTFLLILLQV